jgi:hypothetical protein
MVIVVVTDEDAKLDSSAIYGTVFCSAMVENKDEKFPLLCLLFLLMKDVSQTIYKIDRCWGRSYYVYYRHGDLYFQVVKHDVFGIEHGRKHFSIRLELNL